MLLSCCIQNGARAAGSLADHDAPSSPLLQAGGLVLVDGAHAVGAIAGLYIPAIGADFYTSNLHK